MQFIILAVNLNICDTNLGGWGMGARGRERERGDKEKGNLPILDVVL